MKIEIISMTGLEAAETGWRLSRDVDSHVPWQDIYALDVPVNELPSCHLLMEDFTILEREIFASPRNHVMWARTSHVDDPLQFKLPKGMPKFPIEFAEENRAVMKKRKEAGASQDEWRELLPVMSLTSWTTRISYRDLVKMAGYVSSLANDAAISVVVRTRMLEFFSGLRFVVAKFCDDREDLADLAIAGMQKAKFLHHDKIDSPIGASATDGFYVIRLSVPLWLRAQIIRHRNLGFIDDFYHRVLTSPNADIKTISEPIEMELSTTKEFWKTILSKRSCWIAQDSLTRQKDPWSVIIDQWGGDEKILPCADGICPYHTDAALRLTPADPGTPCPRFLDIKGIDKGPYRIEMLEAAKSRAPYWLDIIAA